MCVRGKWLCAHTSPGLGTEVKDETSSGAKPSPGQYPPYVPQLYDGMPPPTAFATSHLCLFVRSSGRGGDASLHGPRVVGGARIVASAASSQR